MPGFRTGWWDSADMHASWTWVFLPPVVSAVLAALFTAWLQLPRARIRLVRGALTVEDSERLWRGNRKKHNWAGHSLMPQFMRMTNYGNGTAFDVRLAGRHCEPWIWAGDAPSSTGTLDEVDPPPELGLPIWSQSLGALEPGESVTILVMTSQDPLVGEPELTVTWPRLPQLNLWRRTVRTSLRDTPPAEVGWPGEGASRRPR